MHYMLYAEVVPESSPHELFNAQDVCARYCRVASKLHAHRLSKTGLGRGHAEALLVQGEHLQPALWNRNYFLRFRFRLLKSYGSGSNYLKVVVPVYKFQQIYCKM
jgi:hypothetical protein